jgi:type IV pilus assembly protein PilX
MKSMPTATSQRGAVLAVSLILLLVITLVVISGGREVLMQEKMLEAHRDGVLSLAAAEAGLKEAALIIDTGIDNALWSDSGTGGYYSKGNGPNDMFTVDENGDWQGGSYITSTVNYAGGDDTEQNAQFYFEQLGAYVSGSGSASTGSGDIGMGSYDATVNSGNNLAGAQTLVRVVVRATGRSGQSDRIVTGLFPSND